MGKMSGLEIVGFEYPFEDAPRGARKPDIRIGLRAGFMREAYVQFASGHRDSVFGRFVLQSVIGYDRRGRGSRAAGQRFVFDAPFVGPHPDFALACDLCEIDVRTLRKRAVS